MIFAVSLLKACVFCWGNLLCKFLRACKYGFTWSKYFYLPLGFEELDSSALDMKSFNFVGDLGDDVEIEQIYGAKVCICARLNLLYSS